MDTLQQEHPVIAVALDSPYDLLSYPEVAAYLATYGRAPVSMEALALVLFGLEAPRGRLPVELPSLYPAGHPSEQSEQSRSPRAPTGMTSQRLPPFDFGLSMR